MTTFHTPWLSSRMLREREHTTLISGLFVNMHPTGGAARLVVYFADPDAKLIVKDADVAALTAAYGGVMFNWIGKAARIRLTHSPEEIARPRRAGEPPQIFASHEVRHGAFSVEPVTAAEAA